MKKITGIISLVFLALGTFGQEKQTVHSIIVECHEAEWYTTQAALWKKEVELNNENGEAWINYYSAVRALRNITGYDEKEYKKYLELGHSIVKDAFAAIPESFEANYMMYWDQFLGQSDEKYLLKAYDLRPEDPRVLLDLLINAEVKGDKEQFSRVARKLYEINRMPSGTLTWAYNSLTEVSENGILFTAGDNDTYAVWIIQEALNYRKDVKVMNTYMILMEDYQKRVFQEKGIIPFTTKSKDQVAEQVYTHIFENKQEIPVHVSGSAIGQFSDTVFSNALYLTGLTYKYSQKDIENIAVIKRNFEKRFFLDHLTRTFSYSIGDLDSRIKQMYLPGMIKLYQHYTAADDAEQALHYKLLIDSIAAELEIQEEVQKALSE